MAYKITYGPMKKKHSLPVWLGKKLAIKLLVGALLFSMRYWGIGEIVKDWLIPGDRAVTVAAWSGFTEDIARGEMLSDAWLAFCKMIVSNADIF